MSPPRLLVVAPGRGSYGRNELGSLRHFSSPRARETLAWLDAARAAAGRPSISELDAAPKISPKLHSAGENASALTFGLSVLDWISLQERCDGGPESPKVVGVLGNSMGWYSALHMASFLDLEQAFAVVEGMGTRQEGRVIGGQIIHPVVDEEWRPSPERCAEVEAAMARVRASGAWVGESIRLGGYRVLAGDEEGIRGLLKELPPVELGSNRYPFRLAMHSAFHTPLMAEAAVYGQSLELAPGDLQKPLIDGAGCLYPPFGAADPRAILNWTFGAQVTECFDFSRALNIGLRELAPDQVVLLGPGQTLGGAIAQVMIAEGWRGIDSKAAFLCAQQGEAPPLISLGRAEQRRGFLGASS